MRIAYKDISPIGIGTGNAQFKYGYDYTEIVKLALEKGVNFIDTAESYLGGDAELMIGTAIKGFDREKIIICTKIGPENLRYVDVLRSVNRSLQRLDTDYIDVCYIHWADPLVSLSETFSALQELLNNNKIRSVGVSNFNMQQILEAYSFFGSNLSAVQMEYNIFERGVEETVIPFCKAANILFVAYSPLCQGVVNKNINFFEDLMIKYKKNYYQILLRWVTHNVGIIAIPKSTDKAHLVENIESTSFNMTEIEYSAIDYYYSYKTVEILPKDIVCGNAGGVDGRNGFKSIEEAIENDLNLIPSPVESARELLVTQKLLKPIQVRKTAHGAVLTSGNLKYWSWIIAFGRNKPIECIIID